ncbi:MAG: helix-hairpin-helix domain-containing protein [Clostridiales bacterium]|nr:helix-hairpin-helix domain-containing protein [Clostridiales bacterium]
MLNEKKRIVTMLCAAAVALTLAGCGADAGAYLMSGGTEAETADSGEGAAQEDLAAEQDSSYAAAPDDATADIPETEEDSGTVLVYVCGQVNTPGVYELPEGSRVCDAVNAAEGMSDEACGTYWNLAEVLSDGQMLYFPTDEEVAEGGITALDVAEASGSGGAAASSGSGGSSDDGGLVNINTATLEQLETLPGIGEAKAKAIISYREENGNFASTDAIVNVSGIGDATYQNMKDYITV